MLQTLTFVKVCIIIRNSSGNEQKVIFLLKIKTHIINNK